MKAKTLEHVYALSLLEKIAEIRSRHGYGPGTRKAMNLYFEFQEVADEAIILLDAIKIESDNA